MKNNSQSKQYKTTALISIAAVIVAVIALNVISSFWYGKFDLAQDKRHTLSESTIKLLEKSDDIILIKIYLKSQDMPAEYELLAEKAKEMVEEFRRISPNVKYEFIDPFEGKTQEESKSILSEFAHQGLTPLPVRREYKSSTESSTQYLIPGAVVSYKGREVVSTLIEKDYRNKYSTNDLSTSHMEYNLVLALKTLIEPRKSHIAFLDGHGEIDAYHVSWISTQLGIKMGNYYSIARDTINERVNQLRRIEIADTNDMSIRDLGNKYDLLVIAHPTHRLLLADQYAIDQHIMRGGKVLWLLDATTASLDSLESRAIFHAEANDIFAYTSGAVNGLEKMLFKYGVRINPDLIQDIGSCQSIPLATRQTIIFPYALNVTNFKEHPITQKIESVCANFASTIDFVGRDDGLKKTILATSSPKTKVVAAPCLVSLEIGLRKPNLEEFNQPYKPIAVLVEGKFQSAFDGKLPVDFINNQQFNFKSSGIDSKQIFISDGDMIFNHFTPTQFYPNNYINLDETMLSYGIKPTGFDIYTNTTYDNTEFLLNCVDYLCGNEDLMNLRAKVFQIGLLDQEKINNKSIRQRYQVINIIVPLLIFGLLGGLFVFINNRRFSHLRKPNEI